MKLKTLVLLTGVFIGTYSAQLSAEDTSQIVTPGKEAIQALPGDTIEFPLHYSSDNPNLTGLGVTLSFDDEKLEFIGFADPLEDGLLAADKTAKKVAVDNEGTDTAAKIAWMSIDGNWPGEGKLPATLGVAQFKVLEAGDSVAQITISGDAAANSTLQAKSVSVTIGEGQAIASSNESGSGGSFPLWFISLLTLVGLVKRFLLRSR